MRIQAQKSTRGTAVMMPSQSPSRAVTGRALHANRGKAGATECDTTGLTFQELWDGLE